jgi:hypothetical protein
MADRVDAKVLQILSRQPRHHIAIDIMVAEDRLVLLKPEPVEPCRNVHARLPAAATNRVCLPYRDRRLRARYQRGFRQSWEAGGDALSAVRASPPHPRPSSANTPRHQRLESRRDGVGRAGPTGGGPPRGRRLRSPSPVADPRCTRGASPGPHPIAKHNPPKRADNQIDRARVLEVRIHLPPAERVRKLSVPPGDDALVVLFGRDALLGQAALLQLCTTHTPLISRRTA